MSGTSGANLATQTLIMVMLPKLFDRPGVIGVLRDAIAALENNNSASKDDAVEYLRTVLKGVER